MNSIVNTMNDIRNTLSVSTTHVPTHTTTSTNTPTDTTTTTTTSTNTHNPTNTHHTYTPPTRTSHASYTHYTPYTLSPTPTQYRSLLSRYSNDRNLRRHYVDPLRMFYRHPYPYPYASTWYL